MKKWENVARGISFVLIFIFLRKLGESFWLETLYAIILFFGVSFILSKIQFLQKQVTNKIGWLTLIASFIFIEVLFCLF
ncbi:hypothetical protein [Bacillus sp. OV166]|uniref:hypothetical protein n=1 Tax=Bacillus sp. OV166 TaxID=1882763 RepID=UPI001154FADA|nr:hypothetical protein [Bacillus sp. OV166]